MVSLLSRGVGVLVKSLAGFTCTQASRCSSLPSALSAVQCTAVRWFSKNQALHDSPKATSAVERPKRPLSSYFRFLIDQRPNMLRNHPGVSVVELTKLIANEWKGLTEAERQVYIDAERADLLKFKEVYKVYKENLDPLDLEVLNYKKKEKLEKKKKRRKKWENRLLGRPKGPRNAFALFMSENFTEAKGDSVHAKMKNLAHEWENMLISKKQVYMQLAEDDKVRYQNEMKVWEEQMLEIGREDVLRQYKIKRLLKISTGK